MTEDFFSVSDGVLDAGFVGESVRSGIFPVELGEAASGKNAGGDEQGAFAAFVHEGNIPFRFSFANRKNGGRTRSRIDIEGCPAAYRVKDQSDGLLPHDGADKRTILSKCELPAPPAVRSWRINRRVSIGEKERWVLIG
ncbi:MAG TPA: hypothetical protein VGS59_12860 [Candidatus Acidoferrales bacterium]|nr:hypothetical protein [Candidatus Acidoferrales bacterium]